jgi:hypothetical protein
VGGPGSGRRRYLSDAERIRRGTFRRDQAQDPASCKRVGRRYLPSWWGTEAEGEESLSPRERHQLERLRRDDDPW